MCFAILEKVFHSQHLESLLAMDSYSLWPVVECVAVVYVHFEDSRDITQTPGNNTDIGSSNVDCMSLRTNKAKSTIYNRNIAKKAA